MDPHIPKANNHENDMQLLTMPTAQSQRELLNYDIMWTIAKNRKYILSEGQEIKIQKNQKSITEHVQVKPKCSNKRKKG